MKRIILMVLTMFVVAGCDSSSEDAETDPTQASTDSQGSVPVPVPVSIDVAPETPVDPDSEVPTDSDDVDVSDDVSQVCVAIDGMTLIDSIGDITQWTVQSMDQTVSSDECIPVEGSVPIDDEGNPRFIVINLMGVDIIPLISEQLLLPGDYLSLTLSVVQGNYGDVMNTPYSHVRDIFGSDPKPLNMAEELTVDGFNVNVDVPQTYTMAFDLRSMLQLKEDTYEMKSQGMRLVNNLLSGDIVGDINPSDCESSLDDPYVYLYDADTAHYGDLGSDHAPVLSAKVSSDSSYVMKYVPEGNYDLILVCNESVDIDEQAMVLYRDQKLDF